MTPLTGTGGLEATVEEGEDVRSVSTEFSSDKL
jgi:hypothetical protein